MFANAMTAVIFLIIIGGCAYIFCLPFIISGASKRKSIEQQLRALPAFASAVRFDQPGQHQTLALDPASEQWAVVGLDSPARVYGFQQLVAVEIEKDGATLEKTNRGSQIAGAAVGSALLGPVGLLIGGLSGSKRHEPTVRRLVLKLYTNDLHTPVCKITFLDHPAGLKASDPQFIEAANWLDEWRARFLTVLRGQQTDAAAAPATEGGFGRRRSLLASADATG